MAADLFILDLADPSFVPLNSVARQVVFTESGRGVETVIVDGRVVVADRRVTTIDERALREEVADLMKASRLVRTSSARSRLLRKDIAAVIRRNDAMLPYLIAAQHKTWEVDIGVNRYVGNADD
jgi:5-methylthioadenosine/S-adenosylhomocysteine deaminase